MIDFSSSVQQVTMWAMLGGGLLAFISPCVLPMLPVYALYLLGGNSGPGEEGRAGWRLVLRRCLGLTLGFVLLFTLMGAGAGLLGNALKTIDRRILDGVSGALMLVFGLWMMDILHLKGIRLAGLNRTPRMNGFWGACVFGILLALSWTPCLTPVLANALILAASAQEATMLTGMVQLMVFALGLSLPMVAFMLLYQVLKGAVNWLKANQQVLRRIGGGLMVLYGLYKIIVALWG